MDQKMIIAIAAVAVVAVAAVAGVMLMSGGGSNTETESSYTLSFETNGGETMPDQDLKGSGDIELAEPSRPGYTFLGWYGNFDFTGDEMKSVDRGIGKDVKVYAKWGLGLPSNTQPTIDQVQGCAQVKVVYDGGAKAADKVIPVAVMNALTAGKTLVIEDSVNKVSWTFDGSSPQEGYGGGILDTGLTADFEQEDRKITIDFEFAGTLPFASTVKVYFGTAFAGGNVLAKNNSYGALLGPYPVDGEGFVEFPVAHCSYWTLTAAVEVVFDGNGGKVDGKDTLVQQIPYKGILGSLPQAVREGYGFAGWDSRTLDSQPVVLASDTVVTKGYVSTAVWNAQEYYVEFDANGGTGSMEKQTFVHGQEQALSANSFKRSGYLFTGWATVSDGAVAYTDGQTVSDLFPENGDTVTLYAVWQEAAADSFYIFANFEGADPAYVPLGIKDDGGADTPSAENIAAQWPRDGFQALRFNTKADGSGANYVLGATLSSESIEVIGTSALYILWEEIEVFSLRIYANFDGADPGYIEVTYSGNDTSVSLPGDHEFYTTWHRAGMKVTAMTSNADGTGKSFAPQSIPLTEALTGIGSLYVQWAAADSISVTVFANFDGASPSSIDYAMAPGSDESITLKDAAELKSYFGYGGHTAMKYNTEKDGSGTDYALGCEVTASAAESLNPLYLYVIWEQGQSGTTTLTLWANYDGSSDKIEYSFPAGEEQDVMLPKYSTVEEKWGHKYYNISGINSAADGSGQEYAFDSPVSASYLYTHGGLDLYVTWDVDEKQLPAIFIYDNRDAEKPTAFYQSWTVQPGSDESLFDLEDLSYWELPGFEPSGFNTKANGSGTAYDIAQVIPWDQMDAAGRLDVYVMWKLCVDTYDITIHGNFPGADPVSKVFTIDTSGEYASLPDSDEIRAVWTYAGHKVDMFDSQADGQGDYIYIAAYMPSKDLVSQVPQTLYITWEESNEVDAVLHIIANFDGADPVTWDVSGTFELPFDGSQGINLPSCEQVAAKWTGAPGTAAGFNTEADGTGTSYSFSDYVRDTLFGNNYEYTVYVQWETE